MNKKEVELLIDYIKDIDIEESSQLFLVYTKELSAAQLKFDVKKYSNEVVDLGGTEPSSQPSKASTTLPSPQC